MSAPNSASTANGNAAPSASPRPMPISATAMNSTSASSTTAPPVAPIDFSVARVGRLRSTKPCAALATPTPPTISEVRPISARNSVNRSRFFEKLGETLARSRASQPASGKALLRLGEERLHRCLRRRRAARAHQDPRRPAHQRSRLDKAGRAQGVLRDQRTRAKAEAGAETVRFRDDRRSNLDTRIAERETIADLEVEAVEQRFFDGGAVDSVLANESVMRAHRRRKLGLPDVWPRSFDGFDLDQRRRSIVRARHRAHVADGRKGAMCAEKGALRIGQFAMDQREARIAAKDGAPVPRQAVVETARQRIDADDGGDAQRDAGEENAQASEAAAQIAQGEPQDRRQEREACRGRSCLDRSRGRQRFSLDASRPQTDRPIAARRQSEIMGDQHQRRAALRAQIEQQVDDRAPGRFVEIAGRLVGDQQGRARRQRTRQRDALLFAARKLRRIMRQALGRDRPPPVRRRRARTRPSAPASSSGAATFSSAVMVGIRWNAWKTMPILAPRNFASASSLKPSSETPSIVDRTAVGALEARHRHQQRRFARTRRADKPDRLAARDVEAYIAQNMDARRAAAQT